MRLIKNVKTGVVFAYSELLAELPNMMEVFPEVKKPVEETPAPEPKKVSKKAAAAKE